MHVSLEAFLILGSCKENINEEYAPFGVKIDEFSHDKRCSSMRDDIWIMQQKSKVRSDSRLLNASIFRSVPQFGIMQGSYKLRMRSVRIEDC